MWSAEDCQNEKRLEEKFGEQAAEKRGWHWALNFCCVSLG
jgi:hypothetical protein